MIKAGVDLRGISPQIAVAYTVACAIYMERAGIHCWITSASDGKHGPNSLHYKGQALDLRTSSLSGALAIAVHASLKAALGEQFDVVLESDHIHLEFDPKDKPKDEV